MMALSKKDEDNINARKEKVQALVAKFGGGVKKSSTSIYGDSHPKSASHHQQPNVDDDHVGKPILSRPKLLKRKLDDDSKSGEHHKRKRNDSLDLSGEARDLADEVNAVHTAIEQPARAKVSSRRPSEDDYSQTYSREEEDKNRSSIMIRRPSLDSDDGSESEYKGEPANSEENLGEINHLNENTETLSEIIHQMNVLYDLTCKDMKLTAIFKVEYLIQEEYKYYIKIKKACYNFLSSNPDIAKQFVQSLRESQTIKNLLEGNVKKQIEMNHIIDKIEAISDKDRERPHAHQ